MWQTILGLGFGVLLVLAIIWWLPVILIARSAKTSGAEKLIWILLVIFLSWFSWILYLLLAPLQEKQSPKDLT